VVDGTTVLAERSFKVDVSLDFNDNAAKIIIYLVRQILKHGPIEKQHFMRPLLVIGVDTGRETYIKLQSKETSSSTNKVRAIILVSDGSLVTANLDKYC